MRLPFAVMSYRHRSLPVSAQRLINWFCEKQPPGAKADLVLLPTPGLARFVTVGTGPIRGFAEMAGALYVVSGQDVYAVEGDGTATRLTDDENLISDGGAVTMAENGTEMVIVTPEDGKGWIATSSTFAEITDGDFPTASSVTCMDGFHVVTEADTTRFYISALNDATSWDALDYASAEGSPDNLIRAIRVGLQLWLFGERSTEIWGNSGAADFPFERVSGAFVERGCIARDSVASQLGTVFWLGEDRVVYRSDGFQPVRISTHAIEQAIAGYSEITDAVGSVYEQEGHVFYALSFPTAGETFVYDLSTQLWHERESEGYGTWRCVHSGNFGSVAIGGDALDGRLYLINPTRADEDGVLVIRTATGNCFHSENKRVVYTRLSAEFEAGAGNTTTVQSLVGTVGDTRVAEDDDIRITEGGDTRITGRVPVDLSFSGTVMLTISDDGGRNWSSERWRDIGAVGETKRRVEWRRLGSARERVFRLQMSDPARTALIAVNVDATTASH
jgi:hypothetical protein